MIILTVKETPRYLIWKDRREEALQLLKKLHHDPSDPSENGAVAEFTQIVRQVDLDRETSSSFYQLFKRPTWRRRALSAMFLS